MYISLTLTIILIVARIILLFSPNWKAEYLGLILPCPAFGGVLAINLIFATLSDYIWIVFLSMMYPLAILLPFINNKLSKRLANEMVAPNTCLGKLIVFGILSIAPMAGFVGVWLSKANRHMGNGVIGASILGLILHFIFVWGEIDLAQQGWNLIQRNKKK
jgi:hypothetical protein